MAAFSPVVGQDWWHVLERADQDEPVGEVGISLSMLRFPLLLQNGDNVERCDLLCDLRGMPHLTWRHSCLPGYTAPLPPVVISTRESLRLNGAFAGPEASIFTPARNHDSLSKPSPYPCSVLRSPVPPFPHHRLRSGDDYISPCNLTCDLWGMPDHTQGPPCSPGRC